MALLRLTDITQAQSTAITPTTLVHIVTTGDTSQNGAGSSYKAELSQIYDGLSGYCMPQILTSFVIPCSPLGISPNDEGNVYFGSTSGLTVDVVNNRVGIGTSTPSVKLNVKGIDDTSSNRSFLVETSGATPLFSVRNDGFVSVYNASQQFGEKLSVNGTVLVGNSGYLIQEGGGYWQMYSSSNVFGIGKSSLTSPIFGIDVNSPFYIFTQQAYDFGIGLGNTAPSAKLHVNNTTVANTVLFEDDTNPDSSPFVISNTGSVGVGILSPTSKLHILGSDDSSSNYGLKVESSGGTANLYVRNDGNVGIGVSSPSQKLDVNGTTKSSTISATTYQNLPTEIQVAASDETTALTLGTAKVTFRMPYAMTVTEVRGSLTTAQASGSIFTVDINESGTSILSTKLTIDNTEKTSVTAATPPVISDTSLADDSEITVDIDQVGDGTATGLKITIKGFRA